MTQVDLPLRLPPGLDLDSSEATRQRFARSQRGSSPEPLGVVYPRDEEQIAGLVGWANSHGIALVAVSSPDGPRRRGGTMPAASSLIVDLSRMTRVIHADARDAIAIIEPGVTFPEFDRQLRPYGLRSIKPLLPRRSKSVLAAYLEREPTIAPRDHWDSSDPLSALSITFGTGESFRSGTAGIPGTLEANLSGGNRQMMSPGPIASDFTRVLLGSQGTLGIVGWGSIYCEPIPVCEEHYLYGAGDFGSVAELVRHLALRQLGAHCFILDRTQAKAAIGESACAEKLPAWLLFVSLSASAELAEANMAWQLADLAQLAETAGADCLNQAGQRWAEDLATRIQDPPVTYYKDAMLGAHREAFCLTQINRVESLRAAVDPLLHEAQRNGIAIGTYVQPIIQGTACHLEFTLFHDPGVATEADRIEQGLIETLAEAGGFLSRPYGTWSGVAYRHDPGIVPYLKTVKGMLDPNGVLNPGKLCF